MEPYKDTKPFATQCPSIETIFFIGKLELAKRERGMTEAEMYIFEKSLKDPEYRKELAAESNEGHAEADFLELFNSLKYRRKLFKNLKKDGRESQKNLKKDIAESEENQQNSKVNQGI